MGSRDYEDDMYTGEGDSRHEEYNASFTVTFVARGDGEEQIRLSLKDDASTVEVILDDWEARKLSRILGAIVGID